MATDCCFIDSILHCLC